MANCIILTGGTVMADTLPWIQRSLGPYRLATELESNGYSCFVLDYVIHFNLDEILSAIEPHLNGETLWVGFSSTFFWNDNFDSYTTSKLDRMYYDDPKFIETLINRIKQKVNVKIVYGGAKAPYFLADKNIDYYVLGYADTSTVELTHHIKNNKEIQKKDLVIDGHASYIIDSANFPEPKMDSINTSWKNRNVLPSEGLPLELARGCIFKCKFCSYPLLGKKKGTYLRDPSYIKDEMIKNWELYGTQNYYITDDTFNDDNDKIESLHRVFTSLPFNPKFSCYLRVDLINKFPHQADLLTEMGMVGTYFGIETFQPDSAKSIGKGLHPNKVKDRLFLLREKWKEKVNIGAGFILGLPHDTIQYFDELIKWHMENDVLQHAVFFPLTMFKRDKNSKLEAYTSEFSLNPEVYGYNFPRPEQYVYWELEGTEFNFENCEQISNRFNSIVGAKNKVAEFQMISHLNLDIPIDDLYKLSQIELNRKYNIPLLNKNKITEYKTLIGLENF